MTDPRSANVIGLGLIGGSVCLALRRAGFSVHGADNEPGRTTEALRRGVIDAEGLDPHAQVTFVATPVNGISGGVRHALDVTTGWVTDVGSVKAPVAADCADPRFVPGHPMAGSELHGLDGADESMFEGAVWVLTPTPETSDDAFSGVAGIVSRLGAEVVALEAERHDDMVAMVSHVPHLTAATLMGLADSRAEEHLALLRLAAGGFRDMTRIASGQPSIWIDICRQNRDAIVRTLDGLIGGLAEMREVVAQGRGDELLGRLERARVARMNLPVRAGEVENLVEVRVPIPDRPGAAAEVFSLSGDLGVNILDFEVVHSAEGDRGVMVLVVRHEQIDVFRGGLLARGFRPAVQKLS